MTLGLRGVEKIQEFSHLKTIKGWGLSVTAKCVFSEDAKLTRGMTSGLVTKSGVYEELHVHTDTSVAQDFLRKATSPMTKKHQ